MQRREFLVTTGAVAAPLATRKAEVGTRNWGRDDLLRVPRSPFRVGASQEPSLSPEVFARRLDLARGVLKARGLDLPIGTPSTDYEYLTGCDRGGIEPLIAQPPPVVAAPAIVG